MSERMATISHGPDTALEISEPLYDRFKAARMRLGLNERQAVRVAMAIPESCTELSSYVIEEFVELIEERWPEGIEIKGFVRVPGL